MTTRPKTKVYRAEDVPVFSSDLEEHEYWSTHELAGDLLEMSRSYPQSVQNAIDTLVEMAEIAESANNHKLSGWYGSVCQWVREREKKGQGFTLTLPNPFLDDYTLTTIEVPRRP